MKMMPMSAAKLSSVNLVKYLTMADTSSATITKQRRLAQRPIHRRKVIYSIS